MNPFIVGGTGFIAVLFLLFLGIPIAFGVPLIGIIGLLIISGPKVTWMYVGNLPYSEIGFFGFTIIPLFMLMGEFAFHGGLANGVYLTARKWFGRLPGGLSIATIVGGASFGATCGSSVAASAVLAKICIPEMKKYHYSATLASGTVAASANLSSMIPPSGLMIVYAILTNQSVGSLFIAGIMPAIVLSILFSIMVYIICVLSPKIGPPLDEKVAWLERFRSIRYSWPMAIVAIIIIVGIYVGFYTATEAASCAAFWAFLYCLMTKALTFQRLKEILISTAKSTSMLLLILAGVMIFTRFLAVSRFPYELSMFLSGLYVHQIFILFGILAIYLFLGTFFDAISILVLTLPTFYPTITALGYDPIWFGVVSVLMCEIGLLTPPVGMNCYVISATSEIPVGTVFRGIAPFLIPNLILVLLLIFFPEIALLLPSKMKL